MSKEVVLDKGHTTLVDDEDFERVNKFNWRVRIFNRSIHARRWVSKNTRPNSIYLHHFILNVDSTKVIVDHINGDGLDNRKSNLRICTKKGNARNAKRRLDNKSGYKGVYWFQGKWRALIGVSGKRIHLGMFTDLIEAAKAYDIAAAKYFGEFAKLNFEGSNE